MTSAPMNTVMLALLMATAGAMFTMAAAMWRAPRPLVRWTGVIFDLAVTAYALKLWNDETQLLPPYLSFPIAVLTASTVGWFWLFVMALFEDACRFRPILFAPVALLTASSLAGMYLPPEFSPWCWIVSNLISLAMTLHALVLIVRGWKGDLVEARRRLRGPFFATVTGYILLLRAFELWDIFGTTPEWYPMTNAALLCVVSLAGSFVFLESRGELFGTAQAPAEVRRPPPVSVAPASSRAANTNGHAHASNGTSDGASNGASSNNGLDRAAKADLDRLEALMGVQQIWKEEGLTIASLAVRAQMPETQLRRLINDCLGYRNFPSYVNAHRIAAAKARLADPNEARISISAIAFDIGFASLGPFNRAFKEVTGVAPSEWRRHALNEPLNEPSPIPEEV
jgi:AraC-like DNA-binding protein